MKKTLSIIIVTLLIILTSIGNAYAARTYKAEFVAENTAVQGGEITVKVRATNFSEGASIQEYAISLIYDGTIFESVKADDVKGLNGWSVAKTSFNENDTTPLGTGCRISLSNNDFVSEDSDLFSVTLKVKDKAKLGVTNLTLTDCDSSDFEGLVLHDDATTSITIQAASVATPTPAATPKTTAKVTPTPTAKAESMPKTGVEDYIMPAIVVIAVAGIVAYVRFNKMDK